MRRNSAAWHTASENGKTRLAEENKRIATEELKKLGVDAYIENGVWYVNGGKKLYDVYHTGGVVGGGTPSENERLALLKDKEWVLSERMVENLSRQIERIGRLQKAFTLSITDYVVAVFESENDTPVQYGALKFTPLDETALRGHYSCLLYYTLELRDSV